MLKAVIFDMDGVLIDSVTFGRSIRARLLTKHYGINLDAIPDPQGQDHRVSSMKTLLANVESHSGRHIDIEEFAERQAQAMRDELPKLITVDPALVTFLEEVRHHAITCAVVTTAQRSGTDIKLDVLGIRKYFSLIVTGNDIENHKPHPEAYLYAIEKLSLAPDECVIFEDSIPGIQAGVAADCKVIGFTQYNKPDEPLVGVAATIGRWSDITYNKLQDILAITNV